MLRLPPQEAEQLTYLISPHYPYQRIMLITDGGTNLHETLHDFTAQKGFELEIRTVGSEINLPNPHPECKILPMRLDAPRYNRHAKQYENIFVALKPTQWETQAKEVLPKLHAAVKNAGTLALLIRRDALILRRIDALLEEADYVAVGHVEIFEAFDVVTAKKLHGWGSK